MLVLDEVQKVSGWSETVKRLWDEDTRAEDARKGTALKVVVLGSAPLLVERGLTESLAGRFEVLRLPHWSFAEMREAFGLTLEEYVFYGGYPGAAGLIKEPERWALYLVDALIETTISRDVLLLTRVDKPALLRRLFDLGCRYSGQILSYTKMLGQLQEAGNSTTLAHYLDLLAGYWREGNREVDFIVRAGRTVTAIEVKSGRRRETLAGMDAFAESFKGVRRLLVGGDGIKLEEFLEKLVEHWVKEV